jgi:hypothetical protein
VSTELGSAAPSGSRQSVWDSIRSGLKFGVITATLFSFAVTVQRLLLGPGAFTRFGITWATIVAVYYVAFSLGGCAYGALLPLRRRHSWAAAMLGVLFISPMYVGFAVLMNRMFSSLEVALIFGAMVSTFGGIILGLFWWDDDREQVTQGVERGSSREGGEGLRRP